MVRVVTYIHSTVLHVMRVCTVNHVYTVYGPCVEAGWNTSTIGLRVAEGDKGNPVPGGITGPPCHWGT
jgi:hypothetical protein